LITRILCFVDPASLYNLVNKANLVHNFFLVCLFQYIYQSLNVSGNLMMGTQSPETRRD